MCRYFEDINLKPVPIFFLPFHVSYSFEFFLNAPRLFKVCYIYPSKMGTQILQMHIPRDLKNPIMFIKHTNDGEDP